MDAFNKQTKDMTKEELVMELIELRRGCSIFLDPDAAKRVEDMTTELLNREYKEILFNLWRYEILHINEAYYHDFKEALDKGDCLLFVCTCRGNDEKEAFLRAHWESIDYIIGDLRELAEEASE